MKKHFPFFTKVLTVVLFLTTGYFGSFAQINSTSNKSYAISINSSECLEKVNVLSAQQTFKPISDREYNWYAFNKIMQTKGGYDGRILHGEYRSFYPNNNLKEKGDFKKGLKHGTWKSWYKNGELKEITGWKTGLKDGKYVLYNESGKIILEANYKNNILDGKMTNYDDEGKMLNERQFKHGIEIIKDTRIHLKRKPLWQSVKDIFKKKKKKPKIAPDQQPSGDHS